MQAKVRAGDHEGLAEQIAVASAMAVLGAGLHLVFKRLGWVGSRGGK